MRWTLFSYPATGLCFYTSLVPGASALLPTSVKMRASTNIVFLFASVASAVKYGYNHAPVRPDSDVIESAFPDVDVELRSPAFLTPETRQPGFSEGTQGPSSNEDMSKYLLLSRQHNTSP